MCIRVWAELQVRLGTLVVIVGGRQYCCSVALLQPIELKWRRGDLLELDLDLDVEMEMEMEMVEKGDESPVALLFFSPPFPPSWLVPFGFCWFSSVAGANQLGS